MSQSLHDRVGQAPSPPAERRPVDRRSGDRHSGDPRRAVVSRYSDDQYSDDQHSDVRYARSGYAALVAGAAPLPPGRPWLESLRRFGRRHGWRAYALPVLVVVTILALASNGGAHKNPRGAVAAGPTGGASAPTSTGGVASASKQIKVDATNGQAEALGSDALPPGPAYTQTGDGAFTVIPGTSPVVGTGTVKKYVIEYEGGITGVDLNAFATAVQRTLSDPRSWTGGAKTVALQRVAADANADFRISLTSSMTVRALCGYEQKIETSCFQSMQGVDRVTLNVARWVRGDASFGQDLAAYHLYMVNHEVGHALGHMHTYHCLPNGLAPVMMQQTITLKENQGAGPKICQPNAWPYPVGVPPSVAVTS